MDKKEMTRKNYLREKKENIELNQELIKVKTRVSELSLHTQQQEGFINVLKAEKSQIQSECEKTISVLEQEKEFLMKTINAFNNLINK